MALYKYKVSDAAGKISELLIEGDSQADAARRIQRRGLMPLDFLGEGSKTQQGGGWFAPKLNVAEFTERLVPLLQANITLERAWRRWRRRFCWACRVSSATIGG